MKTNRPAKYCNQIQQQQNLLQHFKVVMEMKGGSVDLIQETILNEMHTHRQTVVQADN